MDRRRIMDKRRMPGRIKLFADKIDAFETNVTKIRESFSEIAEMRNELNAMVITDESKAQVKFLSNKYKKIIYRNTPQLAAVGYSRLEVQQQTRSHEIPHSLLWGASLRF